MNTLWTFLLGCLITTLLSGSTGMLLCKKPIHSALAFLITLLSLSGIYLLLSAELIALLQTLVYGGAILILFIFVIVLFQHKEKETLTSPHPLFLFSAGLSMMVILGWYTAQFFERSWQFAEIGQTFGSTQNAGHTLYETFFIPFGIIIVLFLAAIVGVVYVGRRNLYE